MQAGLTDRVTGAVPSVQDVADHQCGRGGAGRARRGRLLLLGALLLPLGAAAGVATAMAGRARTVHPGGACGPAGSVRAACLTP